MTTWRGPPPKLIREKRWHDGELGKVHRVGSLELAEGDRGRFMEHDGYMYAGVGDYGTGDPRRRRRCRSRSRCQRPLFLRIRPNSRPDTKRQRFPAGTTTARRLSAQGIARVVQRAAARAGLDPAQFAGHSLRSGFATEAAAQGASERAIMRQTGHRSLEMVRRYIRDGDRYRDNASTYLGL